MTQLNLKSLPSIGEKLITIDEFESFEKKSVEVELLSNFRKQHRHLPGDFYAAWVRYGDYLEKILVDSNTGFHFIGSNWQDYVDVGQVRKTCKRFDLKDRYQ